MTLYILDTDHVSLFQRGNPFVISKISQIEPENIIITIITVEEQLRGRLNVIKKTLSQEILIDSYSRLKMTLDYFNTVNILEFNTLAYEFYVQLKEKKIRIGTQNFKITSIALSVNAIVVTRNKKDFSQVPNLLLEDWTIKLPNSSF